MALTEGSVRLGRRIVRAAVVALVFAGVRFATQIAMPLMTASAFAAESVSATADVAAGGSSRAASPVASAAGCGSPEQCFARMTAAQRDVASIQARFRQTKHVEMLAEPLVSEGRFTFRRPDQVRWEMETPEAMVVEIGGGALRAGPPGQVADVDAGPAVGLFRDLAGIFTGAEDYAGKRFTLGPGTMGPDSFVLTPRDPSVARVIASIAIELDPASGGPRRVAISEAGGDRTDIELLDVRVERADGGSAS